MSKISCKVLGSYSRSTHVEMQCIHTLLFVPPKRVYELKTNLFEFGKS